MNVTAPGERSPSGLDARVFPLERSATWLAYQVDLLIDFLLDARHQLANHRDAYADEHSARMILGMLRVVFRLKSTVPAARDCLIAVLNAESMRARNDGPEPDEVARIRRALGDADAMLFRFGIVFPEYAKRLTPEDADALLHAWKNAPRHRPAQTSGHVSKWKVFERVWRRATGVALASSTVRKRQSQRSGRGNK